MYNKVTVVGLGTLGGFLSKHISEFETTKDLVLIDHDIVESRNVFRSIYSHRTIGEYKVDALANIIKDNVGDDVTVTKLNTEYIEGITDLPKSDLVIDCRDKVCNRNNEIDVRFYISHKTLIIDCRKNVRNMCDYDGSYSIALTKNEINKAAFYAAHTITSGQLPKIIKNNLVQRIDLDLISSIMNKAINENIKNKTDMIYELSGSSQRLQCVESFVQPILNLNKTQDVEVVVGDYSYPELEELFNTMPQVGETVYSLIPQNSLATSSDVIQSLADLVEKQPGISNFLVIMRKRNGKKYVELLEETGAA